MASLVVPVTFKGPKGEETIRTLIDTGAEMSLISENVARKIGLPVLGTVSIRGAGRAMVQVTKVSAITLPGARSCRSGPMMAWIFGKGAVFPGTGIAAILGFDFMKKARMQIAAFTRTHAIRCVAKR